MEDVKGDRFLTVVAQDSKAPSTLHKTDWLLEPWYSSPWEHLSVPFEHVGRRLAVENCSKLM